MDAIIKKQREGAIVLLARAYKAREEILKQIADRLPELGEPLEYLFFVLSYDAKSLEAMVTGDPLPKYLQEKTLEATMRLSKWRETQLPEWHGLLYPDPLDYESILHLRRLRKNATD
jgi:hypothetical protein